MSKTIKHNFIFQQKPEAVWEYLINTELLAQWLMKNDFQPVVGCDFQFRTNPMPAFNFDGIINCKVLEIVPFKKLSYTWKSGPLDSLVVWTLTPKDNGTELQLEHSGFKETDVTMYSIMNDGWLKNIKEIAQLLNNKQMKNTDFNISIAVNKTPEQVMDAISNVSGWWAKVFEGSAKKLNDKFTVRFGDTFVDFKIGELMTGKKVVWDVINCYLPWLKKDKTEWNGTKVVWEIKPKNNLTQIDMTHVGLVPGVECYSDCEVGWTGHVKNSLYKLLTEGKGKPE